MARAVGLGDTGHERGIDILAKLVGDPIPFVRAHAAIALSQIGHKRGLQYRERSAKDRIPRVASISAQAQDPLRKVTQQWRFLINARLLTKRI